MYIWTAIDIDNQLQEQKEIVKQIENEIIFKQSNVCSLPLHISLKISSEVNNKDELKLRNDINDLYNKTKPFEIEIDKIELNNNIIWIKIKDNDDLIYLHKELCKLYLKYGIELHEYDNDFVFHATLFLDNDIDKIQEAYNKIKNIKLPKYLIANKFIIGSSQSGEIGSYRVDTTKLL